MKAVTQFIYFYNNNQYKLLLEIVETSIQMYREKEKEKEVFV